MHTARNRNQITLWFNLAEARLVLDTLSELARNYRSQPDSADAWINHPWYSTRGCVSAAMKDDELREWRASLHQIKSARLGLIQRCLRQIQRPTEGPRRIVIAVEQGGEFIAAINDHRLHLAAQAGIGQAEMDSHPVVDHPRLKPEQLRALISIHFLAMLVEAVLTHVSPSAAGWMSESEGD